VARPAARSASSPHPGVDLPSARTAPVEVHHPRVHAPILLPRTAADQASASAPAPAPSAREMRGQDDVVDAAPRALLDLYEASGDEDIYARAKPLYEQAIGASRTPAQGRGLPPHGLYCGVPPRRAEPAREWRVHAGPDPAVGGGDAGAVHGVAHRAGDVPEVRDGGAHVRGLPRNGAGRASNQRADPARPGRRALESWGPSDSCTSATGRAAAAEGPRCGSCR
jgi:hypothetical protein